jgi:hypothetical protein
MTDSTLQQLLLQAEVAPPETLWEKMVVHLDELETDKPLQQRILQLEEEVPGAVWNHLEIVFDDLAIQKKITSIEETVPAFNWEQIELALNLDQQDQAIAAALHLQETPVPPAAWNNIERMLDAQPGKLVPFKRTSTAFYRLAAAAAITGILAWGGYRLIGTDSNAETISLASIETTVQPERIIPASPVQPDTTEPDEQSTAIPTRTQIKAKIKQNLDLNDAVAFAETPDHSLENHVPYKGIHHQKQVTLSQETSGFSESQYYMLLNENGELVRVSKKITDLKCMAVSGAVTATMQELKDCNDQIKRWREKMAMAAALSASGGDIDLNQLSNNTTDL